MTEEMRAYEISDEVIDLSNAINDVCKGHPPMVVVTALLLVILRGLPHYLSTRELQALVKEPFAEFAKECIKITSKDLGRIS